LEHADCSSDNEDGCDDALFDPEKPPESPETLDLFELQRYVSKLTEWGSNPPNTSESKPTLVQSEDDS